MPQVAIIPINSFFFDNFNLFSFTPEQKTPTAMTESRPHDLIITIAGYDADRMA